MEDMVSLPKVVLGRYPRRYVDLLQRICCHHRYGDYIIVSTLSVRHWAGCYICPQYYALLMCFVGYIGRVATGTTVDLSAYR